MTTAADTSGDDFDATDFKSQEPSAAFVSHASEDKPFVKQLVDSLLRAGVDAWYDDYQIDIGDSIRSKINEGLVRAKFGIVILSPTFFKKNWPQQELAALATLLSANSAVLPVFYDMKPEEVAALDPLLASVKGISADIGFKEVAYKLARRMQGNKQLDTSGRTIYREEIVSINRLPLDETGAITKHLFHRCLVQGPAILYVRNGVLLSGIKKLHGAMFWPIEPFRPYSGAIALDDVHFVECRFKEVGFAMPQESIDRVYQSSGRGYAADSELPEHLR